MPTTQKVGDRGGTTWAISIDDPTTSMATVAVQTLSPPRCGSTVALEATGTGFVDQSPILAVQFVAPVDGRRVTFDASAYQGIRFALRVGAPATVRLKVPDVDTATSGGICTHCDDHFGAALHATTDWQVFTVLFADMKQGGIDGADTFPAIVPSALYGLEFVAPRPSFELWIDDVSFVP
jgi:hypothetical protein